MRQLCARWCVALGWSMAHGGEGWCFSGQRWGWSDGFVVLSYRVEFQVEGWERDWDWMTWFRCCVGAGCDVVGMSCEGGNDWVKRCVEYRVERAWKEIAEGDCRACGLNMGAAMDRGGWTG